jgi:hypothetical protein
MAGRTADPKLKKDEQTAKGENRPSASIDNRDSKDHWESQNPTGINGPELEVNRHLFGLLLFRRYVRLLPVVCGC